MRKFSLFCLTIISIFLTQSAFALLSLELTRGVSGAVPIAITPFSGAEAGGASDLAAIVSNDLKNSGRFKVYEVNAGSLESYQKLGADNVVTGSITKTANGYAVTFQLHDVYKGKTTASSQPFLQRQFSVSASEMRALAHHISDLIYQHILGVQGVFSTRLAYVIVQHTLPQRYTLEVCDQDGYNPHPLLTSTDPMMSPAWSPNGNEIAYVSFENKRSAIYVQNLITGDRRLISASPGINGAPAWSPDGKRLALVLSKTKSPNIYIMDLATRRLTQLTHDYYINTEPAWSPDGRSIIFTSNRSGNPQVYEMNLASGAVSRVTYEGNYNARASFTPDANHLIMLNRESNVFNIGILDLDTGSFRGLTNSASDNESPSVAPNGSMVLYGALFQGRSVLAMVATDGSVQIRLPARNGEVQDPAWSPFLG